ncbi:hypothetical protein [Pararhizobium sp.]|uniref:hypothetical protein n=1 Tax=Pararhizobium sp. TaxID=1977563 RepID=UPI0027234774|nr:hypothetical protein [Pararhizobium sp.]MDO9416453.1 hypothetical protein [Pararhizobium sp.]
MRKFILSAIVATVAAISFAAPSQAGGYSYGNDSGYITVGGYDNDYADDNNYGHKKKYYKKQYQEDDYYEPVCVWKKVKRWDSYGNVIWKKIKVCH